MTSRRGTAARARRATVALLLVVSTMAGAWLWFIGGLLWWSNVPRVVGWQPYVVLSGSMRPSFAPGDVVVIAPVDDASTLPVGRIVLVSDPTRASGSYVHRVVGHRDGALITRGDANPSDDGAPVEPDRVLGEVRVVVPAIGLLSLWLDEERYGPLAVAVAGTSAALVLTLRQRAASRAPSAE